jgi:GH43 family beta-xylosidase
MLSLDRVSSKARRRALTAGLGTTVVVLVLAVAALFTLAAPNAGARAAREDPLGRLGLLGRASAFKQASGPTSGATSPGLPSSVDAPQAVADPEEPAIIDRTGWDDPDPFVLVQNGEYYLFTGSSLESENVPVRSGASFGSWGPVRDALPDLPAWATHSLMWSPDVARFGNHYMLYFTSQLQNFSPPTICIGDAISTAISGPYIPSSTPFICQGSLGGSIDPRVFVDGDGQPYMVWKSNQNALSPDGPTQIWTQRLSSDGTDLVGSPQMIFTPDESWQGGLAEAPQLMLVQGSYYLFYSGAWFNSPNYAIGVATCAGPQGPCHDTSDTPLLGSNLQGWGPGEESLFTNEAGIWMVYSPWFASMPNPGPPRPVALARIGFSPSGPYLAAPYQNANAGAGTTAASRAP